MGFVYAVFGLVLVLQNYNTRLVHAAPQTATEACPPDSILSGDECKCLPEKCPEKPPCPWTLELTDNSTASPGSCCPSYRCVGCPESNDLDEECPCAPGAKMDDMGRRCVCEDEEKHLINGECVCNPAMCELPPLCDKKSVAVSSQEGCCMKTICKQCPLDSESTNLEVEELEDHCVCLPCELRQCGANETAVIKKKGSGFPGNCCDLYECEKIEKDTKGGCLVGDILYKNGDQWHAPDMQTCTCTSGLSLCTAPKDVAQNCYVDKKMYKHLEEWTAEDGCLLCTCYNGNEKCVSHFCYSNKETKVHKNNETESCLKNGRSYQHLENWLEKDGCTNCTCFNGTENCSNDLCDPPASKISECQPLAGCNKTCLNGYKINKKGCEICKCNTIKLGQDILGKYNITMGDLIAILEDYKNKRTSTTTISTTSTTSATTTTPVPFIEILKTADPVVIAVAHNAKLEVISSTTTEPSVVPTGNGSDPWIYIIIAVITFAALCIGMAIMCVYRSKRKSSIDLTQCQYESVNNHNNNNTIKKTDQLL